MNKKKELAERAYEWITDEGELRVCDNISASACKETPLNFFLKTPLVAPYRN